MASEEQKEENRLRLTDLTLLGLASSAWDALGETCLAFSSQMGDQILEVMEKEMGLEIAGDDPQGVITEIGRIFVDELGFSSDIDVEVDDGDYIVKVKKCVNIRFTDQLMDAGVEKLFTCPIMNACQAALKRMNYKMRGNVAKWAEEDGSIITFKGI